MTAPPVEVRDATPDDLRALRRALGADAPRPEAEIALVLLWHGEPAGHASVGPPPEAALGVAVAPAFRGLGLGKMLLAAAEARAAARGARVAVLVADAGAPWTWSLGKAGWTRADEAAGRVTLKKAL